MDSQDYIYVGSTTGGRIGKYVATTGAFVGWIGKIATQPTAGASGCSSAAVGEATPGWCVGGSSATGSGDGMMMSITGLAVDGTNWLYVSDVSAHRLLKFNLATGAFAGWRGKVATVPTGGDPGCAEAAVGNVTPGWCMGGTAASGNAPGAFSAPNQIQIDANGILYVGDSGNQRIVRVPTR